MRAIRADFLSFAFVILENFTGVDIHAGLSPPFGCPLCFAETNDSLETPKLVLVTDSGIGVLFASGSNAL